MRSLTLPSLAGILCLYLHPPLVVSQTWQFYQATDEISSLAAQDNEILVCSREDFGFVVLDSEGNPTFYNQRNENFAFNCVQQVAITPEGDWLIGHAGGIAKKSDYKWTGWDTSAIGLSFERSAMTSLKAGPNGRIAVGTLQNGFAVYDGKHWSVFNILNSPAPSDKIRDLNWAPDHSLFVATYRGLVQWKDNHWTIYHSENTGIPDFTNLKSVAIHPNGDIWVAYSNSGLAYCHQGAWNCINITKLGLPDGSRIGQLMFDQDQRLWMSTSKAISVLSNNTWKHFSDISIGCNSDIRENAPKMAIDGSRQLWTGTCGLSRLSETGWEQIRYQEFPLPNTAPRAIAEDANGDIWLATDGIIHKSGNQWQKFLPETLGAQTNQAYTVSADQTGNVWFGMLSGEILHYQHGKWTLLDTLAKRYPGHLAYWTIACGSDGSVWFPYVHQTQPGTRLARLKNGEWKFFSESEAPIPSNQDIICIKTQPDGTVWFQTSAQLIKFDGWSWETYALSTAGLPFTSAYPMAQAPDGTLWIPTDKGIIQFDGSQWTTLTCANFGLPAEKIVSLAFDGSGSVYIGHEQGIHPAGVSVYRNGLWTQLEPHGWENHVTLPPPYFFIDRSNKLWFCSANPTQPGVFVYDPEVSMKTEKGPGIERPVDTRQNPVSDCFLVHIPSWDQQVVRISIMDLKGNQWFAKTTLLQEGAYTIHLPTFMPAGEYALTVHNDAGKRLVGKFMKV
jgi:ligand-binding sensor domain-containing protein